MILNFIHKYLKSLAVTMTTNQLQAIIATLITSNYDVSVDEHNF